MVSVLSAGLEMWGIHVYTSQGPLPPQKRRKGNTSEWEYAIYIGERNTGLTLLLR